MADRQVIRRGIAVDVLPGMNARASTHAVPSPIEGSGTAWVLLGSWALSPARPTPIHPRRERRGLSALLVRVRMQVVSRIKYYRNISILRDTTC
jgi:hypothetical protein